MIPRILHYCWYGSKEKPEKIKRYMRTWSKIGNMDHWVVNEWNEENCDLDKNEYVRGAAKAHNFTLISDYFRLVALYEHGGIYLDTDVEVYKSFEDLLEGKNFLGYMYDSLIGTAVLGFEKQNPFIGALIDIYDKARWVDLDKQLFEFELPNGKHCVYGSNNGVFTELILCRYQEFRLDGTKQETNDFVVFPMREFEVGAIIGRTHCVHRCEASGSPKSMRREAFKIIKNCAKRVPVIHMDSLIRTLTSRIHTRKCSFYERYAADRKKGRQRRGTA